MSKCIYCKKEFNEFETRFISLIHNHAHVCEKCVWQEDMLWFSSKHINQCPDFSDELKKEIKFL